MDANLIVADGEMKIQRKRILAELLKTKPGIGIRELNILLSKRMEPINKKCVEMVDFDKLMQEKRNQNKKVNNEQMY